MSNDNFGQRIVLLRNRNGVTVEECIQVTHGTLVGDSYVFNDPSELWRHLSKVMNFPPLQTVEQKL